MTLSGADERSVSRHSVVGDIERRNTPELAIGRRLGAGPFGDEPSPTGPVPVLLPEDQPRRVLVDILDRLVELGERAAAVDGEGLEFLEAGI